MLAYTLARSLTQKALIERDEEVRDKYGGETETRRVVLGEVSCLLAPFVEASRARSQERATPVRTIAEIVALLVVGAETDVTERDWIKEVLEPNSSQFIDGPFRVVGVVPVPLPAGGTSHLELALERP